MEWLDALLGKTVGLDTAPLIYYIEENQTYESLVNPFFDALHAGQLQVVTSVITLLEVLVLPIRNGDEALASEYNDILLSNDTLSTVPVTAATAEHAAQLRAQHNLRAPDAIQLAVALKRNAEAFLTNDARFPQVPNIEVLKLDQLLPNQ